MYKNIVRLFLKANAYNQLSPLKPTIIRILESKHGPTYWIIEHADKMVKTIEQETAKKYKANTPLRTPQNFSQNVLKISQFCNFYFSFLR